MKRWRVFYFRPHRKQEGWETRDQVILESESEPTVEQVQEATSVVGSDGVTQDTVLRLDGVEEIT